MEYLPLFFDLKNQPCLLVGGGDIALRKAMLLDRAGAKLTVIAPEIDAELIELVEAQQGKLIYSTYADAAQAGSAGDGAVGDGSAGNNSSVERGTLLDDKVLVIAATDDDAINEAVHADASARKLPINVVDSPHLCSFVFPAIVDRSPIMIAVSSGGNAPVLTRLLRAKLETMIPSYYGYLGELAARFRQQVKDRFDNIRDRRIFWERVFQGPVADKVIAGQHQQAEDLMTRLLNGDEQANAAGGEVYLVGAGPGDPELLTFKALRLMQQADVVLYDRLVSPKIVDLCRRDADRIFVGKERSNHSVPQGDINLLLAKLALEGKRVLRLKGGDPFIFGRGGEELETLVEHKVPFQVVPGITAASACSSYAGIPLTHRDYAQSVKFVTGQLKNRTSDLKWNELVHPNQTIVFYMGLHRLEHITKNLVDHGKPATTPVALVQSGSTPDQRVLTGTLADIVAKQAIEQLQPPTLMIVGEVVELHDKLAWFNEKVVEDNHLLMTAQPLQPDN